MRINANIKTTSMAGFGAAAWDSDTHKISMHPPIPGHIEYVEEHMVQHEHENDHHVVKRRHPENDCEENLIAMDLPIECWMPRLKGKKYVLIPKDRPPSHSSTSKHLEREDETGDAVPGVADGLAGQPT